ncbi:MAG TPA: hypothetical protein VEH10_03325, partial [Thermoplasmata archaeon]|nr:hypothetical protein [Thermoplasmata archaeon]
GSAYVSVPSAYSYGGETGETVTGANVAWSNGAGGPFSTYGTMTTGPSILTGLWNATAPEGSYPVTLDVTPANAFVLVGPHDWPQNFTVAEMAVVPAGSPETIYLAPGNYSWQTVLSDYASASATVDVVGPTTVNVSLTSDPALGIYTPLWAFSNSELAALSTSGNGTPSSPYVIENVQSRPIVAPFGLYNDFGFPAYPAVFLANTNATTEFDDPPSFSTVTDVATPGAGRSLPYVNDLQYWFWNASNVAVVNATNISGWFAASTYYPAAFNTFSVVFYEGGHDLVAGDTFDSEGQGLLLFSGGSFFGPLNVGGGNSTVWGDRFVQVPAPNSTLELLTESTGLGLEVAEANDLVYDNDVDTPTTAWLVPMNLYSGAAEFFQDSFNITREPASAVRYASGFPFEPLTGSIAGTSYQGGNFWWDYGIASNPFNGADDPYDLLPYEERGVTPLVGYGPAYYSATYIYPGGDYLPLTTVALYPVVIRSAGLPDGLSWGANLSLRNGTPVDYPTANGTSAVAYLPNGSYSGSAVPPVGWAGSGPRAVKFSVAGAGTSLTLSFRLAKGFRPLTFAERGLAKGTPWSVTLNGLDNGGSAPPVVNLTETSVGRKLVFAVVASAGYAYAAAPVGGYTLASPSHGSVDPAGGRTVVHLEFVPVTYTVTFTETGLPNGTLWKVSVDGRTYSSKGASIAVQLPNGTSAFTVRPAQGYQPSPHTGAVTVAAGPTSVSITYAKR